MNSKYDNIDKNIQILHSKIFDGAAYNIYSSKLMLTTALGIKDKEIKELKKEIQTLKKNEYIHNGEIENLENEVDRLNDNLYNEKKERDSLSDRYNNICDDYNDLVDENKRLNTILGIKQETITELNDNLDIMYKNFDNAETLRRITQKELEGLRNEYKNLQDRHDKLLHYPG